MTLKYMLESIKEPCKARGRPRAETPASLCLSQTSGDRVLHSEATSTEGGMTGSQKELGRQALKAEDAAVRRARVQVKREEKPREEPGLPPSLVHAHLRFCSLKA